MTKYIIGIDFGTTNCTMAYAAEAESNHVIEQFKIPQAISQGSHDDEPALPSFIYFPLSEEIKAKAAALDWDDTKNYSVGHYARDRGAEMPYRTISSAKSWLCNSGIDRRAPILPLGEEEEDIKVSPLEACAKILQHMREAWNAKMADAPFDQQKILVTVPASFDPSARQFVIEASQMAGYPEIVLLEEPQAAFYAWLNGIGDQWRKQLKVDDCILVVDIGGGTTDFSLISVEDDKGNLGLKRVAVGSHLLLGGDNIDLSLAYLAKQKLEDQGHNIDDWQVQALVHTCRQAKEKLMGPKPPKSVDITIMGRGSKLIGGSLKTTISRDEAAALVIDGFTPLVSEQERSINEKRSGIQQIGLPYAQDPRISCQLAKFLSQTGEADNTSMDNFIMPTAVLFNGGTTKSTAIRVRILELLNSWAKELGKSPVKELEEPDYDFAVSRGAVYYGIARQGKAIRIKSGTSRSYYIGVEDAVPAVPGMQTPLKAFCIVPFGMEEGTEQFLENRDFALVLGEQATFRFFSHATPKLNDGTEPVIGTIVKKWSQELTELHPIDTILDKAEGDSKTVKVKLKSKVTELGVLELWCDSTDGRRWKLEFDIRQSLEPAAR